MPTFPTPDPITASVELVTGSVHIVATDRDDTVVGVRPRDPNRASDVRIAEQARIDFRNGTLTVSAGRRFVSLGRGGAVNIDITAVAFAASGVNGVGRGARRRRVREFRFSSASGDLIVGSVAGNIKADTASGGIAEAVRGAAAIATASGDTTIGELAGDVKFRAASGSLSVRHLQGTVNAQTSSGDITVAAAVCGAVSMQTSSGEVEIGVAEGTAARLDVRTGSGELRNALRPSDGPAEGDETLTVHVRTGSGDVGVQRAPAGVVT
jgi:hypothetical protein